MSLRPDRAAAPLRAQVGAVALSAAAALAFVLVTPGVGDLWAAKARESAVAHGVGLEYWFSWFGGTVPGGYSVIAPFVSQFTGVDLLGAAATVVTVVLCARLVHDSRHPALATWVAAVAATLSLWSGRVPFALGSALMVAALLAVRGDRRAVGGAAGVAAALASPVSGAFLLLGLVGVVLHRREHRAAALWTAAPTAVALVVVALWFGMPGPSHLGVPQAVLAAAAMLALLLVRPARYVSTVIVLSVVGCPFVAVVPNGMGSNFERLAWICLPVAAAATARVDRPLVRLLPLGIAFIGAGAAVHDLHVAAQPQSSESYYAGLVQHLGTVPGLTDHRVEAVPDGTHVAAYALLGHATLARGYETQRDNALNAVLTQPGLDAASYRTWLDDNAVGYVLLDRTTLAPSLEDTLVRDHRPDYLHEVWSDAHWQLFRVSEPTPIVERPATIASADQSHLVVDVPQAGQVEVRVRWSRFLDVDGDATLSATPDGWTLLDATTPGTYRITG